MRLRYEPRYFVYLPFDAAPGEQRGNRSCVLKVITLLFVFMVAMIKWGTPIKVVEKVVPFGRIQSRIGCKISPR